MNFFSTRAVGVLIIWAANHRGGTASAVVHRLGGSAGGQLVDAELFLLLGRGQIRDAALLADLREARLDGQFRRRIDRKSVDDLGMGVGAFGRETFFGEVITPLAAKLIGNLIQNNFDFDVK